MSVVEIPVFHLCCGSGFGALGFNMGQARVGTLQARFVCLGGVDSDPAAIRDFTRITGTPGTVLDLFSREQYLAFHGHEPPKGWREATADDLRRAAGGRRPAIIFISAPCKGFSGLLSAAAAASARYQALNGLAIRALMLALEAWGDDPPPLILFENVPRIQQRGRHLLDQITGLLRGHGYATAETTHDCGELGGLAQHRKRFLLVARHMAKVPSYLYEPPKRRVRAIGEVLGELPMPEDPAAGPMHRLPRLTWQTWVRLALIPAGGDWRDLPGMGPKNAAARKAWEQEGKKTPGEVHLFKGKHGVQPWDRAARTVIGGPSNGAAAVADPRWMQQPGARENQQYGVVPWQQPAHTVTGQSKPGGGAYSVADPRWRSDVLGVRRWEEASGTVTGRAGCTTGAFSVADPRGAGGARFNNVYRVVRWDEPSVCVTGAAGNARGAVADPRPLSLGQHHNKMRVEDWTQPAHVVTGSDRVGSGAPSVSDPRPAEMYRNILRVVPWEKSSTTVTGATRPAGGAQSVADPRPWAGAGHYGVLPWDQPAGTVAAAAGHDNGRGNVADPRLGAVLWTPPEDVPLIIAEDGTWHRPLTTFDLAALQGYPVMGEDGPLVLDGKSHSGWRERIGNGVPTTAATAMAGVMGQVLLMAVAGVSFSLSSAPIWVRRLAIALSVAPEVT